MILQDILYKVAIRSVKGNTNIKVKDLQIDSRKITAGSCFIATATEKGTAVIVCEVLPNDLQRK